MKPNGMKVDLGKGAYAMVDASKHEAASAMRWHMVRRGGSRSYAATNVPDPKRPGRNTLLYLHRFVTEAGPGQKVVFRGDTLDCRLRNLIVIDKTSSHNGVSRMGRMWQATGHVDGTQVHIGLFRTELEAAAARRRFDDGRSKRRRER